MSDATTALDTASAEPSGGDAQSLPAIVAAAHDGDITETLDLEPLNTTTCAAFVKWVIANNFANAVEASRSSKDPEQQKSFQTLDMLAC